MTIGIYSIKHRQSGKRYIGKSIDIERRIYAHKYQLKRKTRSRKATNRHLYNAVSKYGWDSFDVEILEAFQTIEDLLLKDRELFWIDHFRTCNRVYGYNLRRDSSTSSTIHEETRELHRQRKGARNSNYGNAWSKKQRSAMRLNRLSRSDRYGDRWRKAIGEASREFWKNHPDKKYSMARKVAVSKQRYRFIQYTKSGELIRVWDTVKQIVKENPNLRWQNIYQVCSGQKPSHGGFIWKKELRA